MVNIRNVIVDAHKMSGLLSEGQSLDGTKSLNAEAVLNGMISSLNLEGFFASSLIRLEYTTVEAKREYSIGITLDPLDPPADIVAQRPSALTRVYYVFRGNAVPVELPIVGAADIYSSMVSEGSQGSPSYVAYASEYPLGKIIFNISPNAGSKFVFVYNKIIPEVSFNDDLAVPPEYTPALKYGLAYQLAVRYGRPAEVIMSLKALRDEAYQQIRQNIVNVSTMTRNMYANNNLPRNNILNMGY